VAIKENYRARAIRPWIIKQTIHTSKFTLPAPPETWTTLIILTKQLSIVLSYPNVSTTEAAILIEMATCCWWRWPFSFSPFDVELVIIDDEVERGYKDRENVIYKSEPGGGESHDKQTTVKVE
jgi:hypothetical protein